jgi:erythromycin esterase-like protein
MLDISTAKVVRVIALTREYGPDAPRLTDYISGLNEDEQASLVACMWIGRDSFEAEDVAEALRTAREERTAPTEDYLTGIPELANYLEDGMEKLGLDVSDEEDQLSRY